MISVLPALLPPRRFSFALLFAEPGAPPTPTDDALRAVPFCLPDIAGRAQQQRRDHGHDELQLQR